MTVTRAAVTLALAAGAVLLTPASGWAGILTGPVVNPANGHTYYLLTESSWQDAQAEAVTLGGNLVTINDAAEQAWVLGTFASFGGVDRSLWIGLNDAAVEGTFVWASGEPVTYTNWHPGEPNAASGGEDYVHTIRAGNGFGATPSLWNDLASPGSPAEAQFAPLNGVVEVNAASAAVPEPASLALVGAGGLGLLGYVRRRAGRRTP